MRKRARIAWSILLESSAACSSCLRAAPPRRLVPFSAQLSASRSWLQCLPPFSRPGPTKHIGQVLTPCTKSGSCVLVAAWAGLCRFRGGLPSSSWGELCIRGVPATVTSVPSILSPSQRGGRAASLGGRSWPGAGRSASGLPSLSLSLSLLCFALGQGERAVPFPRSFEQPRPPFWLTGSAVRGTYWN